MGLIQTLAADAEHIAETELPAVRELPALFSALVKRVEATIIAGEALRAVEPTVPVPPADKPGPSPTASESSGIGEAAGGAVEVNPAAEAANAAGAADSTITNADPATLVEHVEAPASAPVITGDQQPAAPAAPAAPEQAPETVTQPAAPTAAAEAPPSTDALQGQLQAEREENEQLRRELREARGEQA